MIYLIEATDYIVIDTKIKEILNKNNLVSDNIIKYDLLESPISTLIEDLDTFNLLVDRKVIIGSNATFLGTSRTKGTIEHNELELQRYIDNPNPDNILVLICDKVDNKKKTVKILIEKATFIKGQLIIDDLIKERLEGFKMDFKTIKFLINYCDNDNERILTELEKLKCYKFGEKEITTSDIEEVVTKANVDNIFSLIDAIVAKKSKLALNIYKDLLKRGEDISKIVIMVADQFRLIYQSKVLVQDKMKQDEIASKLKVHPYRVKLAIEKGYSYEDKVLLKNILEFANIDYMIKTGKSNPNLIFESFLCSM